VDEDSAVSEKDHGAVGAIVNRLDKINETVALHRRGFSTRGAYIDIIFVPLHERRVGYLVETLHFPFPEVHFPKARINHRIAVSTIIGQCPASRQRAAISGADVIG